MDPLSRWVVVVVTLTACAGCGGDDDDVAQQTSATTDSGLLQCEPYDGLPFGTTLESCDEARTLGAQLASDITGATEEGADLIFASTCSIIQGDQTMTYSMAEDLDLATALSEQGACPGDLAMLVRN